MATEFMALTPIGKEAKYLRDLIFKILLVSKLIALVYIHYDSEATLAKAYSKVYKGESWHIGLRHRYVRNMMFIGNYN